jgi:glycerol-3-phosphate acyltransferase PlsY
MLHWILACATAYALGSIPFAFLAARVVLGVDIRKRGSGNVGAANLSRLAGWPTAVAVAVLDVGKGALAVWLVQQVTGRSGIIDSAGVAAVLGHVYPPWLGFRGGKGVATAAGVFALLVPTAAGVAALVFLLVTAATRYVSLGSVVASVMLTPVSLAARANPAEVVAALVVAVVIVERHQGNLVRLWRGTERRLGERVDRVGGDRA